MDYRNSHSAINSNDQRVFPIGASLNVVSLSILCKFKTGYYPHTQHLLVFTNTAQQGNFVYSVHVRG